MNYLGEHQIPLPQVAQTKRYLSIGTIQSQIDTWPCMGLKSFWQLGSCRHKYYPPKSANQVLRLAHALPHGLITLENLVCKIPPPPPAPPPPPLPSGIQIGLAANYRDGHFIHVHFPVVVWGLPICILISACTCYMYSRLAVDWLISLVISILISCAHAFNPLTLIVIALAFWHTQVSRKL